MAFREMALTATILIVVSLSLTLAPTWSMAILILLGMIFHQVCKIINEQSDLPVSDSRRDASAHNDNASAGPAVANSAGAAAHSPPVFGPVIQTELSSTSLRSSGNYYEVFLSFRGPDIREAFADELYNKLRDAGIKVFKDDEGHGEEMKSELIDTITLSRVSIPIFSENYASSRWCLQELELMQKSTVSNRQIIFPIFYDVSPFDVRHQAGDFGRSFNLHEIDRVDSDTIETWRKSLQQVTGLRGAYLENTNAGHKSKLVRDLVKQVQQMLRADFRFLADGPSGIDFNVEELMRNVGVARSEGQAIKVQGGEVRAIGICGMPGVGKITLAKAVFSMMHMLFDACSFVEDIGSKGVQFLQQRLIADLRKQNPAPLEYSGEGIELIANLCRHVKVLIVLDDVCEDKQIRALARNLTWFGSRSRIIVTKKKEIF